MIHILYNPLSNNKRGKPEQEKFEKLLNESISKNAEKKFYDITAISEIKAFFEKIPAEDVVVVAGGDGTISNFAHTVYELDFPHTVYYYACGSGNDFYNDVKDDPANANNLVLLNKYLESLPYVIVNNQKRYFVNGIGFGIDGYACEEGDKIRAKSNKKVNYTLIAIKGLLGGFHPVNATVTVDGETSSYKKVWLAPSMIGRYYGGGMKVAPAQNRLNEEKTVSSIVAHDLTIPKIVSIFPKIFKGNHVKHTDYVTIKTGHEVTVVFDKPVALQIDGETVSGVTTYSVVYK